MSKRKSISKKVRFDVFKRDNFTCQYCGKKAPDVVLEVDHIKPVSKGGNNGMMNLITSCFDCNRGKSDKTLNENQTLAKELKQMEQLSQRKEQIEMMFKWQNELLNQDDMIIKKIHEYITTISGETLNEYGMTYITKWIKKYSIEEILKGVKESINAYDDFEDAIINTNKIIATMRLQKKKPYMKQIFYIRGILRNRLEGKYYDNRKALNQLTMYYEEYGVGLDELTELVKDIRNWSEFMDYYED